MFCIGDVNIEKAHDSLISNDRSWKKSRFRLTYTAEAPALTQGIKVSFKALSHFKQNIALKNIHHLMKPL